MKQVRELCCSAQLCRSQQALKSPRPEGNLQGGKSLPLLRSQQGGQQLNKGALHAQEDVLAAVKGLSACSCSTAGGDPSQPCHCLLTICCVRSTNALVKSAPVIWAPVRSLLTQCHSKSQTGEQLELEFEHNFMLADSQQPNSSHRHTALQDWILGGVLPLDIACSCSPIGNTKRHQKPTKQILRI